VVHFTVERDGRVRDVTIVHGSGSDTLDQAAMALLQDARLAPFPADMTLPQQSMTVPIHFRLE
jgi:TonB family protein